MVYVRRSRLVLSYFVGSEDQTHIIRIDKCIYLVGHLTDLQPRITYTLKYLLVVKVKQK